MTLLAAAVALVVATPTWTSAQNIAPTNGRDGGGVGGVREQDRAAERTAARLNSSAQQNATVDQGQAASSNDLLMRAGIVIDARNANRMIVERVIPNSPAATAGLVPGDVITRVNGNPVTSLTAVAQALISGAGNKLGLQVDRNGQSRQLNLSLGQGFDNSTRAAMRTDFGAPLQSGQNPNGVTTVGGVPVQGTGTAASGVTPGLGTTTAQSAGGRAAAAGQPVGVGQGTATAPGQAARTAAGIGTTATQATTGSQAAGIGTAANAQLPTTTTGNPPTLPGTPTSPTIPGNPTSPSLQVQSGGINQSFPSLNTSVPGVPTAAQGTTPATIPSSQGTVNPAIGGGASPTATGAGTNGAGATPMTSSQGTVNPSVGGGTNSATTGAIGAGAAAPGAAGATGTAGTGVGAAAAGAATGGTTGGGAAGGASGAGTGGGAGGAGGGAAGGT
jgi:membrane-associated protease RseP (regulator of RpoE activity)